MSESNTEVIPDTYLVELSLALDYYYEQGIDPYEQEDPDNSQDFDEDASEYFVQL